MTENMREELQKEALQYGWNGATFLGQQCLLHVEFYGVAKLVFPNMQFYIAFLLGLIFSLLTLSRSGIRIKLRKNLLVTHATDSDYACRPEEKPWTRRYKIGLLV